MFIFILMINGKMAFIPKMGINMMVHWRFIKRYNGYPHDDLWYVTVVYSSCPMLMMYIYMYNGVCRCVIGGICGSEV